MRYAFILFLLLYHGAKGQNPGPRLTAMGSGGAAVSDVWSIQQNPAGMAVLKRPILSVAYEQHFMDAELSTQTALVVVPFLRNVVGASFERYGFSQYNEQKVGISFAKSFGNSFCMAIGAKYYQLNIYQYGSANAFAIETGFQYKVTDDFTVACYVGNPNQSQYKNQQGPALPVKLSIGSAFRFSDKLLMIADLRKLLDAPLDGTAGIEYDIIKWFSLRGGISANPFKQYSGFGIRNNKLQMDVAVSSHPVLGFSPQISLGYEF